MTTISTSYYRHIRPVALLKTQLCRKLCVKCLAEIDIREEEAWIKPTTFPTHWAIFAHIPSCMNFVVATWKLNGYKYFCKEPSQMQKTYFSYLWKTSYSEFVCFFSNDTCLVLHFSFYLYTLERRCVWKKASNVKRKPYRRNGWRSIYTQQNWKTFMQYCVLLIVT